MCSPRVREGWTKAPKATAVYMRSSRVREGWTDNDMDYSFKKIVCPAYARDGRLEVVTKMNP